MAQVWSSNAAAEASVYTQQIESRQLAFQLWSSEEGIWVVNVLVTEGNWQCTRISGKNQAGHGWPCNQCKFSTAEPVGMHAIPPDRLLSSATIYCVREKKRSLAVLFSHHQLNCVEITVLHLLAKAFRAQADLSPQG
jgi:hypothetical protein